jgi:Flp pilus assembly protein TadG
MKIFKKSERGQALVIIAVGMIALIALTALTIDGGNAYSDRRHAQNAADTSALAAALAKIRHQDLSVAGLARAAENGYDNDGTSNIVEIFTPPIIGLYSCSGTEGQKINPITGARFCDEYIQVRITSYVKTYFAPIVGVTQMTNQVNAVARAIGGGPFPLFGGQAVASMNESDCKSVTFQGGATATLEGSGLYVNSSCFDSAFFNNSSAGRLNAPCLYAVGGIQANPSTIQIPSTCYSQHQPPQPFPAFPNPECTGTATKTGNTMSPGTYNPGGKFPPAGVTTLESGTYCLENANFTLNAQDTLVGHDVFIYVKTGGVTINGGATVTLDAPGGIAADGSCVESGDAYQGLLLYVDKDNDSAVGLSGGGALNLIGTILAPASECTIIGGGAAAAPLQTQIACDKVTFSGSSSSVIKYDPCNTYKPQVLPRLEQTK